MAKPEGGGPEVVFTTSRFVDAGQVCGLLEARGFLARVLDDNVVTMAPRLSGMTGGIKVVVPAEQAAEARAVLADAGWPGPD